MYCSEISQCLPTFCIVGTPEKTWWDIFSLAVSSLAPAIAIFVSIIFYRNTNSKNAKDEILKINENLLSLAISYPYLENDTFCNTWNGNPLESDEKTRYNLYCCKVYNMLILLYEFCGEDYGKMKTILDVDDYITTHKEWFSQESDTVDNAKFNKLIHDIVKSVKPQMSSTQDAN